MKGTHRLGLLGMALLAGLVARPTAAEPLPGLVDAVVAGTLSERLRPLSQQLRMLYQAAQNGDWGATASQAEALGDRIRNTPVTSEELGTRAALAGAAHILAGDLQAQLGHGSEARSLYRAVQRLDEDDTDRVRAVALANEALQNLQDQRFSSAVSLERRARDLAPDLVPAIIEPATTLYQGNAPAALQALRQAVNDPIFGGRASLYAAAAALASGQVQQAAELWQSAEGRVGQVPLGAVVSGLIAASQGDLNTARQRFAAGAQRDFGRYQPARTLKAIADMALGDVSGGATALGPALSYAPDNFRALGVDLLRQPSSERAKAALRQPRYWWWLYGYRPGELLAIPVEQPAQPTPPAPAVPEMPQPPAPDAPVATPPAGGGELPPLASPLGDAPLPELPGAPGFDIGAPLPPVSDGEVTESQPLPEDQAGPVIDTAVILHPTQAVEAYQTGLRYLRLGRVREAQIAFEASVRLHTELAEGWLALGQVRSRRGDERGAAWAYRNAAEVRDEWPEALYSWALALERLGYPTYARGLYAQALEIGLPPRLADWAHRRLRPAPPPLPSVQP